MKLAELLVQKRIQDGDIGEFEQLFRKYYAALCRHSFSLVHDMDNAEDIVQEFFYQFWKNRATFQLKFSISSYLYQSIRNNSLMYLRQQEVKQAYINTVVKDYHPYEAMDTTDLDELNIRIESILNSMPTRVAASFRMNRFEGLKYHEIADKLSVSIKTVEADMGKALQLLRASIKEFRIPARHK